jgi:hypothetical protein
MRRSRGTIIAASGILVAFLMSLTIDTLPAGLQKYRLWIWLAFVIVVIISLVLNSASGPKSPTDSAMDGRVEQAAADLARTVRDQWQEEASIRLLQQPEPIRVRWSYTHRPVSSDPRSFLVQRGSSEPPVFQRTGDVNTVAETFIQLPHQQLVVIGQRGAGKTVLALVLTLDLLEKMASTGLTPVLLSLSSWDPRQRPLWDWLADRISQNYPALTSVYTYGHDMPRRLIDNWKILPILDGFDEIPPEMRVQAIRGIASAVADMRPVVVTCRTEEYEEVVAGSGQKLATAAVLEIEAVNKNQAIEYLRSSSVATDVRWDPVFSHLDLAVEGDPLLETLSSPLMVWLARVAYAPFATAPAELLDNRRYGDRRAIEEHLLDSFIPAIYLDAPAPAHSDRGSGSRYRRQARTSWTAAQATRWLSFLACYLENRSGDRKNIAWRELSEAAPRMLPTLAFGIVAGVAGGLGLAFSFGFGVGLIVGPLVAFSVTLVIGPRRVFSNAALVRAVAGGILGAAIGAVVSRAVTGGLQQVDNAGPTIFGVMAFGIAVAVMRTFIAAFVGGLYAGLCGETAEFVARSHILPWLTHIVCGVGIGLTAGLATGVMNRRTPTRGLRFSALGFVSGLAVGVAAGLAIWIQVGAKGGIPVGVAATVGGAYAGGFLLNTRDADLAKAATPMTVLHDDRGTFYASCLGLGLAMGLGNGLQVAFSSDMPGGSLNGPWVGLETGLLNLLVVGVAFGFLQACWGSYVMAMGWLVATS